MLNHLRAQFALISSKMLTITVLLLVVVVGHGLGRANAQAIPMTPFISPATGTYTKGVMVTITDATPNTIIYYTIDGSAPTVASEQYTKPISVPTAARTETIRAFGVKVGVYGSATSATFTIVPQLPQLPAPSFSLAQGYYMGVQSVSLAGSQLGGVIHYTIDGSTPNATSPIYNGTPIHVAERTTITAFITAIVGYSQSQVVARTYSIIPTSPFISPAAGIYTKGVAVTITDATPGTIIYYTTDGSSPTVGSSRYTAPISIPTESIQEEIRSFATLDGVSGSATSSEFTISPQVPVLTPVISPVTGSYSTNPTITISDSLSGAKIYYTVDGSTPASQSTLYRGPLSFPQTQVGITVVKAIAEMAGYLPSAVSQSTITLSLPSGVVATAVVNANIAAIAIPSDFLGFSHEWGVAQSIMGQTTTGVNQIYRKFVDTLSASMGGPLVLRIGGGSTDLSGPVTADTVVPFAELAQASNVKFILGVNLGANNLGLAEQQAGIFTSGIPSAALVGLEIGNEPDGYSSNGFRPSTYSYSDFLPQYQAWAMGVSTVTSPPTPIAGPTLGGVLPWEPNAQADVANSSLPASIVTQHKYVACYHASNPLPTNVLLLPTSSTQSLLYLQPYATAAHKVHARFRIGELNSICNGGQLGVSNSFSSALWAIDTMFEYANIGVDGVNWNTNADGGAYDLFYFNSWKDTFVLKGVNPLYYGLLFFAEAAGQNAQLLNTSTLSAANLKVWITKDGLGHAHIVVINKEPSVTGNVQITLPGYSSGMISRLTASSYEATSGITIGGQTYNGSQDGALQGSVSKEPLSPTNDIWTIPVNAMSAVAVDLQP
jgi:hypothetical protein